jgi:hypothetical protein
MLLKTANAGRKFSVDNLFLGEMTYFLTEQKKEMNKKGLAVFDNLIFERECFLTDMPVYFSQVLNVVAPNRTTSLEETCCLKTAYAGARFCLDNLVLVEMLLRRIL